MPEALDTLFVGSSELALLMRTTDWSRTPVGVPSSLAGKRVRHHPHDAHVALRDVDGMGTRPHLLLQRRLRADDARREASVGAGQAGEPGVGGNLAGRSARASNTCWPPAKPPGTKGCCCFSNAAAFRKRPTTRFPTVRCIEDDGQIAGMFCVVTEETDRVIGERRLGAAARLGARARLEPGDRRGVERAASASLATERAGPAVHADLSVRR